MDLLQALATFGSDIAIAFSGAEDVALIEYAHLTGRPYRVFRCAPEWVWGWYVAQQAACGLPWANPQCTCMSLVCSPAAA